ncbi:MAG: hypothetical protein J7K65_08605 [Planctomycetes bacterium]|nr:hypothetical protein [Planctomycetota bacterium]
MGQPVLMMKSAVMEVAALLAKAVVMVKHVMTLIHGNVAIEEMDRHVVKIKSAVMTGPVLISHAISLMAKTAPDRAMRVANNVPSQVEMATVER